MPENNSYGVRCSLYTYFASTAAIVVLWMSCGVARAQFSHEWEDRQYSVSEDRISRLISPPEAVRGIVVASLSPYYRAMWQRDAGLVQANRVANYMLTRDEKYIPQFEEFIDLIRYQQGYKLLAHAKWNANHGTPMYDWPNYQDDGPAIIAASMTDLARFLLEESRHGLNLERNARIVQKLYQPRLIANSVIKIFLEYTARQVDKHIVLMNDDLLPNEVPFMPFDIWEEVQGSHFFNASVQGKALWEGSKLAEELNDPGAADYYRAKVDALDPVLDSFWNGKIIVATKRRYRQPQHRSYKGDADLAVILGVLLSESDRKRFSPGFPDVPAFAPNDPRVLSTAYYLENDFREEFEINKSGKLPGTLIGRYREDRYAGVETYDEVNGRGNGWVLANFAFAELYHRIYQIAKEERVIRIHPESYLFFRNLPGFENSALPQKAVILASDPLYRSLLKALRAKEESFAETIQVLAPDHTLYEQHHRVTGEPVLAVKDLGWSHVAAQDYIQARRGFPRKLRSEPKCAVWIERKAS